MLDRGRIRELLPKVLVANRGEIAVRVIRACRELGITSVAVYSDADRTALHVLEADEAYRIGPAPSTESYLSIERVLAAADASGAAAVHPGYGFLSENPDFARACGDAGLIFVGPSAASMEALGDKVRARALMQEAGVPVVPGTGALAAAPEVVERHAEEIGYPVLLKAAAGGGGKGMRVVRHAAELRSLLAQARGEAGSAFGDDRVFLERFLDRPRHIEVQVLADGHGGCIHLGERECSVQRRHQKLLEESPSPVVDAATRERIGSMAVAAARAAGYVGAGTVELLRAEDGTFFFMEVNARLQVEHPVTELVFGLDLVEAQLAIAAGAPLPVTQEEVAPRGHALEMRIVAEDPSRGFVPSPGRIDHLQLPAGPGVRNDEGIYPGALVPLHYDPLLAKLVVWAATRDAAIARALRALREYRVDGVRTSIPFHRRLLEHPAFRAGDLHTGFLEQHGELLLPDDGGGAEDEAAAIVAAVLAHEEHERERVRPEHGATARSGWRWPGARGWRA